ncbi:MAG: alpha/beta fold hydrolase [Myxococcales bacterium FL481]|nr:MAG: alpha/beta fold hydrolase [Myxococcales bacterium FL481]
MAARLSRPRSEMAAHYHVVVVGSGYGGAIAASRFARAGRRVCLLERGREWLPGDFPDTPAKAAHELQVRSEAGDLGRHDGLYEFVVSDDIDVFKGCGLGGTSLVNANVAVRPDARVFEASDWPTALRRESGQDLDAELERGYARAFTMLRAVPYPRTEPLKLQALARGGQQVRGEVYRLPINVTFADTLPNPQGVDQPSCTDCGDCVTGCNVGAKNTTAMNYLPDAVRHGAHIFCGVDVQRVEKGADARWQVFFDASDVHRDRFTDDDELRVAADIVVLAGGTLGSTEVLLRSRVAGLPLSERLGERFTGNGDFLGFDYNADYPVNAVGAGPRDPATLEPAVGPCITGVLDRRGTADVADGFVIEDGVLPGAFAAIYPAVFRLAAAAHGQDTDTGLVDWLREQGRELLSVGSAYHGAVRHTQTFLVMSHDSAAGQLELIGDRVQVRWPQVGDEPIFETVSQALHDVTEANGGTYVGNPHWTEWLGKKLITVHPLGGCVMADDATRGVVDHKGRVFCCSVGDRVHEGLYVADGAVVPRSLGINPLLTIAALAERICHFAATDRGWVIDYDRPGAPLPPRREEPVGVRFTESMKGFFAVGADNYAEGHAAGEAAGTSFEFLLTIAVDDVRALLDHPGQTAAAWGSVRAPLLSDEPLTVTGGTFCLFVPDEDIGRRRMEYRLPLHAADGRELYMEGFKLIGDDGGPDLWTDTTTLHIAIHQGRSASDPVLGRGVLRIEITDFVRQLTTMLGTGGRDELERLAGLAAFGRLFAGTLFQIYAGVLSAPATFEPDRPARRRRRLRAPRPEILPLATADGRQLRLTRFRAGSGRPVILSHGLGVSSRIFSLDTIDTNLVEFLCGHGHDVWALDYRASCELPAARGRVNADDVARFDYPAAVDRVREVTGADAVNVVAHCFGSSTLFMALLSGLEGVHSVVASQIGAHVVAPLATRIKSGLHLPGVLDALGFDNLDAAASSDDPWWERAFDRGLQLWPREAEERCGSATCHRVEFLYALLYEHDQLNHLTHDTLHELFGVANIHAFRHLALMVRKRQLVTAEGEDAYLCQVGRLGLPITFIHGAENHCFLPESTERTYAWLCQHHDPQLYTRHVVPDFGHIDCIFGRDAVTSVYPLVQAHLRNHA